MNTTKTMTLDELRRTPLTEEEKQTILVAAERARAGKTADDPECPPQSKEELAKFRPWYEVHPDLLKPQLFKQVDAICAQRGCSRTWFLNQAVENFVAECLEDAADYEAAVMAWEEYEKSGRKSYTLDEVKAELGL